VDPWGAVGRIWMIGMSFPEISRLFIKIFFNLFKFDDLAKRLNFRFSVIPAEAGIQYFQPLQLQMFWTPGPAPDPIRGSPE
jgi:hypothetical protein